MLDKLKQCLDMIKGYLTMAFGLLVFVGMGIIYVLLGKVGDLKNKLAQQKAEQDLRELLLKKDEAEHEADKAESDYTAVRNKYLSEHSDS